MMHVGMLGTDFRNAPLGMRDRVYLDKGRLDAFLDAIPPGAPIHEFVALSTCNRVEMYYVCEDHDATSAWLRNFLSEIHHVPSVRLESALREYRCGQAVRHLFKVAAGMDSMVFGEHEILGQVRDAYACCVSHHTTGPYLNRLFQQAVAAGKEVRSRTGSGQGSPSVVSIAIERMREVAGDLDGKRILVVGAGVMGVRMLKRLKAMRPREIGLANRTEERAAKFCAHFGVRHVPFDTLRDVSREWNIVVLATSASREIITPADLTPGSREPPAVLVIDLGAPRNADPAIGALPGITVICIDDLRTIAEERLAVRKNDIDAMATIIEEQASEFTRWYNQKAMLTAQPC